MRWFVGLLLVLTVHAAPLPVRAQGEGSVDLLLVLLTDVSRSIDDSEFELEKQGYAAALTNPQVLAAIRGGVNGAIAVSYVEFAGSSEVQTVTDWAVIRDAESAAAFVARMQAAPRSFWGRTSISAGIEHAMKAIATAPYVAEHRVIDVCGDGTNNAGREVTEVRDEAVATGITLNGLAIINDHPVSWTFAHVQPPGGLTEWYRQNVIGGVGAFVLEVHDFETFGAAVTRKLVNEIAAAQRNGTFAGVAR